MKGVDRRTNVTSKTDFHGWIYPIFNCPGLVIEINPAHVHMHWEDARNTGCPLMRRVGGLAPGVQGAAVTGMQGMGVRTPIAAEVAEATVGFAILVHIPKGGIFTMGLKSMMVAIGLPDTRTRLSGNAISVEGATPNVHIRIAPAVTTGSISILKDFINKIKKCIYHVAYLL